MSNTELLKGCGREMAEGYITKAVEDAETVEHMNGHIAILEAMSVHILATIVLNDQKQNSISPLVTLEKIRQMVEDEFIYISNDGDGSLKALGAHLHE